MMDVLVEHWPMTVALIGAGVFAGLIAGLFGVGGGVVIVPALYTVFGMLGVDDAVRMKMAVATSLATIIVTSSRSVWSHYKRGAVDVRVLKSWGLWMMAGAFIGAFTASATPGPVLAAVFGVFLLLISLQMGFGQPEWRLRDTLPGGAVGGGIAALIGLLSSMVGIGGGVFGIIIMTLCGKPIHRAVGTAAGFGATIGLPAALGFMIAGWGVPGRPALSLGYVNLIGFVFIASLTVLMAPVGVRLAHALPVKQLRILMAVLLFVTGLLMLGDVF